MSDEDGDFHLQQQQLDSPSLSPSGAVLLSQEIAPVSLSFSKAVASATVPQLDDVKVFVRFGASSLC